MQLTSNIIKVSNKYQTPCLLFSLDQIKKNFWKIKQSINGVEVFYAIKANDHPKILEILNHEGASFEVSSINELRSLLRLGVDSNKISCLNPIKNPEFLNELNKNNVEIMAYDSIDEVDKIVKYAPKSKLVLRITVDNEGSDWPLTKKFGVSPSEAIPLLKYAKKKGLEPIGITFHVGSQCLNKNNWSSALFVCNDIWSQARIEKIKLTFLSLGGGLPIQHTKKIPTISEISDEINKILAENFKNKGMETRVSIEPGRGLVGDAAIMVTSVVGKAKRGIEDWIYIDVGVFNGLMETIEGFAYEIETKQLRKKVNVTIAGPSCDSVDIPFKNKLLSEVKVGEKLYIINAGAYTTVYAANFNGFERPKIYFLD